MIERERHIKPLYDLKHRKDNIITGFDYENNILRTPALQKPINLDSTPFPAYHLIDMERYLSLHKKGVYTRDRDVQRNISVITSRGCPYQCVFCSVYQSMGRIWRPHSPEYLREHIRILTEKYRVKHIHFEDDNLLLDLSRFLKILDILTEKSLSWDTPNGIRVDLAITENILKQFKNAGCKSLTIGVESGDQGVLDTIVKKKLDLKKVEEFARRCQVIGIPLKAFFILGFPGETIKTMQKTIQFALSLVDRYDVEIINLIATPLYGTELFDICQKNSYFITPVTPQSLSESTISDGYGLISTPDFTHQDVERMSKELTAKTFRKLLIKRGLLHPFQSLKRIGNGYILLRTLKRIFSDR